MPSLVEIAAKHVKDILVEAIGFQPNHGALVIHDQNCELAIVLTEAYRLNLPEIRFLNFDSHSPQELLASIHVLKPGDLVVLIQSTNFRLDTFRLRVELFQRGLKVIEHMHLQRMAGIEAAVYIDALAYDAPYLRGFGRKLQARINTATQGRLECGSETLHFRGGFESAKVNIGDYTGMKNVGGLFPIGEVFTEAKDLTAVTGRLRLFAFADSQFEVAFPEQPLSVEVEGGRIVAGQSSNAEWEKVLNQIRKDEGEIWVRELGFGLNRAMTPTRRVRDIGTYERMCGIHLSIGAKHAIYPKPGFGRHSTRHHVDVFVQTDRFWLEDDLVFTGGSYTLTES